MARISVIFECLEKAPTFKARRTLVLKYLFALNSVWVRRHRDRHCAAICNSAAWKALMQVFRDEVASLNATMYTAQALVSHAISDPRRTRSVAKTRCCAQV